MNSTLKVTFALIFSLTFFACSEDNELIPTETRTLDKSTMDKDFRELALMLSKKMKDEDVVNYIYQKAAEKFDGDYDILLAKDFSNGYDAKTRKKGSYVNLKTLLAKRTYSKNNLRKSNDSIFNDLDSYFDDLLKAYPTLQISVPNYSVKSKTYYAKGASSNKSPLVAYSTNSNENAITAFDENGREYILTNDEVPERPVIVISNSERIIALKSEDNLHYYRYACPELLEISESPDTQLTYYTLYNCDDIYSGGGNGGNTTTITTPHRDYNDNYDNLYRVRFSNMKAKREYESWWRGDAEVMVKVIFAKNDSGIAELGMTTKHINGGFIEVKWWGESFTKDNNVNIQIVNWNKKTYGDRMKYKFYEMDNDGTNIKVDVSLGTKILGANIKVAGSFTIKSSDKFMGDFIVDYSSDTKGEGTKFSTGSFLSWINQ